MVEHAICITCGEEKFHPYETCGRCGLTPTAGQEQKRKSLYMSEYRFGSGQKRQDWLAQLQEISGRLGEGKTYDYDSADLARMDEVEACLQAIPVSAVWKTVLRFFAPALVFLALLWGAVLLLRGSK